MVTISSRRSPNLSIFFIPEMKMAHAKVLHGHVPRNKNHPLIRALFAVNCRFTIEGDTTVMKGNDFTDWTCLRKLPRFLSPQITALLRVNHRRSPRESPPLSPSITAALPVNRRRCPRRFPSPSEHSFFYQEISIYCWRISRRIYALLCPYVLLFFGYFCSPEGWKDLICPVERHFTYENNLFLSLFF